MDAAAATSSPAVPQQPVITIISSDGESFSLSANTVTHSHLLDGAVRRWAEMYQVHAKPRNARSGSLPTSDDATTTDVTADDPEETPDEGFIEQYYDETASDLTAASGMGDENLHPSSTGGGGGGGGALVGEDVVGGSGVERPPVMRMVSVPINDEDEDEGERGVEGGEGGAQTTPPPPPSLPELDDGIDSDRTASLLPSSHEGSLSSSTTPTKATGTSGDTTSSSPTATPSASLNGVAPRSISPFLHDAPALPTVTAAAKPATNAAPAANNGSLSLLATSGSGGGGGGAQDASGGVGGKSGPPPRSPVSRSSHPSPSTLMDADQSTPSVLSEDEADETEGGGAAAAAGPRLRQRADPRNLGDEGLEGDGEAGAEPEAVGAAAAFSEGSASPSPSPEAAASNSTALAASAAVPAVAPLHVDPRADALSSNEAKALSPLSRARMSERRHTGVVIQADAAEDEEAEKDVDADPLSAPDTFGGSGTVSSAYGTPGSARSGNPSGHLSASPAPDWRSPSSCHQRTPCIADEDDVGVMVGDDEDSSSSSSSKSGEGTRNKKVDSPTTGTSAAAAATDEHNAAAKNGTGNTSSPAAAAGHGTTTSKSNPAAALAASGTLSDDQAVANAAAAAAGSNGTLVYRDGIRITSSAIVVDLLPSAASTPMVSPQSLREGGVSMEGAAAEQELLSPSSAGNTVAGGDELAADVAAAASLSDSGTGQRLTIHSRTLQLCIRYMTHFAETEAQASAAAAAASTKSRKHKHRHHHHHHHHHHSSSVSSSSTASSAKTSSSSDDDDDDDKSSDNTGAAASSTASSSSLSPPIVVGAPSTSEAAGQLGGAASAGAGDPAGGPAVIPVPLPAPLVARLSQWERGFLYRDVLGAPESVLTAAMAITEVCPEFDYACPGPYLGTARVRAALMTPPPPPDGVHVLMEVMAAARQLQIDPLHALCAGWLADFMIRVSYGATDNFEAAHLIRQCLRVPSHWTRRETDCLKLENEWPANEDAE